MVRIIIDNLPGSHGKKTLAIIAQRIVAKYRQSFLDEIDGKMIGTGYDSQMKQFGGNWVRFSDEATHH